MTRRTKIIAAAGALGVALFISFLATHLAKSPADVLSGSLTTAQTPWFGFFYQDFKVPQTPVAKREALQKAERFKSLDDCLAWGNNVTDGNDYLATRDVDYTDPDTAASLTPQLNNGFMCGLNCKFDGATQDMVCEQRI